jgi:hypothetical protein
VIINKKLLSPIENGRALDRVLQNRFGRGGGVTKSLKMPAIKK